MTVSAVTLLQMNGDPPETEPAHAQSTGSVPHGFDSQENENPGPPDFCTQRSPWLQRSVGPHAQVLAHAVVVTAHVPVQVAELDVPSVAH